MITNVGPGAPGAGRHDRAGRRGEGGADRRAAERRRLRRAGGRGGAAAAPAQRHPRADLRAAGAGAVDAAPPPTFVPSRSSGTRAGCAPRSRSGAERHARRVQLHPGPQPRQRAGGDRRRACARASLEELAEGARKVSFSEPARRGDRARAALSSSTTATTPTRSRCVPRSTTSPTCADGRDARRAVAVLGDMRELGEDAARVPPRGRRAGRRGGRRVADRGGRAWRAPTSRDTAPRATCSEAADAEAAPRRCARADRAGRRRARQGLAVGRPRARRPAHSTLSAVAAADGRDPDRGARLASDLDLPRARSSSSSCARASSASTSARKGPAEHHLKAGTPTMGGLVIFTAIAIPYLILSDRDAASLAVFGTALACAGDRLRRRLAEDREGPLARAVGARQARAAAGDRDRPVVRRDRGRRASTTRSSSGSSTARSTSAASTSCWSSSCSRARPTAST